MRNLKRVLSLALASVMLLGMMVVGAGAADAKKPLTDLDKVTNKEAVNLMVDLKIIEGKPDGSFDPTGIVDRATMAKLVYKVLAGDADESVYKGSGNLKDVPAGHWAEGFINYCYSLKIIAGDGTGNFMPGNKVTTVAAAKMLLVALGYDATLSKYEHDSNWSVNIMKDAQRAGLLSGVAQKATDELTRDNAALMIFNALMANTVVADTERDQGVLYLKKYIPNATTLGLETYNLAKVTGKVASATSTTTTIAGNAESKFNRTYDIVVPGSLGKTITLYAKFDYSVNAQGEVVYGAYKSLYSTQASLVSSTVLGTNAKGTSFANLTDSDNAAYISTLDDGSGTPPTLNVEYYFNGSKLSAYANLTTAWGTAGPPATGLGAASGDAIVAGEPVNVTSASASTSLLGKGVVVSFIDNDSNGKADVVDIVSYVAAKVTSYSTKDKGSVTFSAGIGGNSTWAGDKVVGFDSIVKDDYVTLTHANGKVTAVKADTVEGKITSKNTSKGTIVIDGSTYELAKNKAAALVIGDLNVGDEVILALDASGYIIAKATTSSTSNDKYLYVVNSDPGGMAGRQTKVVFSDGTIEVVTVAKIDGAPATGSSSINGAYTFTEKDGKYSLSAKLGADQATGTYQAKKGVATISNVTGYTNGATLFVDTINGKTFTGFNGLPGTLDFTAGTVIYSTASATGLIKIVYMSAGIASSTGSKDEIVIADTRANESQDADGNTLYTYTAVVNGEQKDVILDADSSTTVGSNAGIYTINAIDTDGVVTNLTLKGAAAFADKKTVVSFEADTLVYDTNVVLSVNEDTLYIEVNATNRTVEVVGSGNIIADGVTFSNIIVTTVGTTVDTAEASTAQYVYIIK